MANYTSRKQLPANSGGSYTPKANETTPKYVLAEKVRDMIRYARPQVTAFPVRDSDIRDALRQSMLALLLLANEFDRAEQTPVQQAVARKLANEFADLKELIVLAADKDYYARKYAPPLSLKKREVWSRYNRDIDTLIASLDKG